MESHPLTSEVIYFHTPTNLPQYDKTISIMLPNRTANPPLASSSTSFSSKIFEIISSVFACICKLLSSKAKNPAIGTTIDHIDAMGAISNAIDVLLPKSNTKPKLEEDWTDDIPTQKKMIYNLFQRVLDTSTDLMYLTIDETTDGPGLSYSYYDKSENYIGGGAFFPE